MNCQKNNYRLLFALLFVFVGVHRPAPAQNLWEICQQMVRTLSPHLPELTEAEMDNLQVWAHANGYIRPGTHVAALWELHAYLLASELPSETWRKVFMDGRRLRPRSEVEVFLAHLRIDPRWTPALDLLMNHFYFSAQGNPKDPFHEIESKLDWARGRSSEELVSMRREIEARMDAREIVEWLGVSNSAKLTENILRMSEAERKQLVEQASEAPVRLMR